MSSAAIVILAIVGGVAALTNWWVRVTTGPTGRTDLISKPTTTIAIGLIGMIVADAPAGAEIAAAVAFVCCLAGDIALLDEVDQFVAGLAAFLVGHLAFVVAFVFLGLDEPMLGGIALVLVGLVVWFVGRPILAGAKRLDPAYLIPVQAYLAVISAMAVVGWSTGRPAAIIGSTLFVASDSVLGWRKFVGEQRWMGLTVMVTYHAALLGLALALA